MFWIATLVLALPCAAAPQEDAAPAAWAALMKEHEECELGYPEQAAKFAPRFREFADAHEGTPEALQALFTLFGDCWWKRSESEEAMHAAAQVLADEMLQKYADADGLAEFATRAYVLSAEQKEQLFGKLRASGKRVLQATGIVGLARVKEGDEATALWRLLEHDYADVPYRFTTHGKVAQAMLHKHAPADLEVGKVAPDIEGVDGDGTPFRLADYRGKVVVLDFWGHW